MEDFCPERKIELDVQELERKITELKLQGKKICFTTGAFDVLHEGHLRYLLKAKELGDVLVVGVDCDDFVKRKKGEGRPINKQENREVLIAGFSCVNLVTRRDDIINLLKAIVPDVLVRSWSTGDDMEKRPECEWVRKNCGEVIILEEMSLNHTSNIIELVRRGAR